MQTRKLCSVLPASYRSNVVFLRNVAVNAATVNEEQDVKVEGRPWQEVPGPKSLPLIGQLYHFLPGGLFYKTTNQEFTRKALELYGPIVRLNGMPGMPPMIMLFDPQCAEQVLRGENWLPHRPGFQSLEYFRHYYKNNNTITNEPTGLVTDHGEPWKQFRSTVNPILLQPKTIKLYTSALEEVANDMIQRMKSIRGEDNMLKSNFDLEMNLWALESIGVVALGGRLNCFDPNLPEDSPARQLIRIVHDIFEVAEQLDFKPSLWRFIATPTYKKAMHIYSEQERLTKHFLDKAKEDLKNKKKTDDEKGVLEKLLDIDEKVAHIMASDMLFAGVDTTANTIMYNLYLLAVNPKKQEKLREEVMSQNDKKPYLKACIKESLRLLPVVSGNMRMSSKEYNLRGYKIPKGTHITFIHQDMAQLEEHYIKPKEYIPERWLVPKDDPLYYGNAHPFAYSPFGFGARMCIGRRIAELEVQTFLAKLIQNFKVEWVGPPLNVKQTSLNYAAPPYNFVLKDV
ncbi:cytochrome P450 CYP12A2-like isoform X1 [Plodia interpunctella]|uniref:cytochrome P450 CYP12A2-like isoform X1 n=1 Tax=Plodia interpunctella TaxID=58824 RepID=UPI0023687926|nr:cytochrome P450 CYP12A2-like isoform X1 [Plodia interpunctella]